jgi:hypothetical protein
MKAKFLTYRPNLGQNRVSVMPMPLVNQQRALAKELHEASKADIIGIATV